MKEASGELNMTLVTIIAVAALGAIFAALYPTIKTSIEKTWGTESEKAGTDIHNAVDDNG